MKNSCRPTNTCASSYVFSSKQFLSAATPGAGTPAAADDAAPVFMQVQLQLQVNGKRYPLNIDGRTSVLDALREHCGLKGLAVLEEAKVG